MVDEPLEPGRVTLADIARAAQVSVKTVSLALRGDPAVSRQTASRIQRLAAERGYVSRGTRRQVIGVVVPYIGHRVYADLFGYLRREAASDAFTLLLAEGQGDPSIEQGLLEEFRWRGVDGAILIAPRLAAEDIDRESRFHQPIVTIGMAPPQADRAYHFARIELDHEAGGRLAARHLLEHGRTRIAYLAGRLASASDQGRRRGYEAALRDAGIAAEQGLVVEVGRRSVQPWPDYSLGYEQCVQLLERRVAFDAILAYSDAIAIGALRALRERTALSVPDAVSAVGFDGLPVSAYLTPKLTSVAMPWERVALSALEALINLMGGGGDGPPVQRFAPLLVPGESVARCTT